MCSWKLLVGLCLEVGHGLLVEKPNEFREAETFVYNVDVST